MDWFHGSAGAAEFILVDGARLNQRSHTIHTLDSWSMELRIPGHQFRINVRAENHFETFRTSLECRCHGNGRSRTADLHTVSQRSPTVKVNI